ncbi:MAG: HAD family hydrolase [Candidatus Hodarchaeota archaeon]
MRISTKSMKKPSVFLFDLDGVILDSEPLIIQSWKNAHKYISPDIEWEEEKFLNLMGQPAIAIPKGMGIPEELHGDYVEAFRNHLNRNELPIFDDVLPVLDKIKELRIPTSIITGARTKSAVEILNDKNMLHYFSEIIGADLTTRGKPFSDPIVLTLKKLNITMNKNVFFIGDSINDLLAARAAGITSVLLWRKQLAIPQKMRDYADYIIPNLFSILKYI